MGERAVLVELPSMAAVHRMWAAVSVSKPPGVVEVVAGARTLLLRLHTTDLDLEALARWLPEPSGSGLPFRPRLVRIPVCYDGPDLDAVADQLGVDGAAVSRLHSSATYTVGFLGFSPGFAYLAGGPPELNLPRRATPRTSVPAGSVAVAAGMTAVYPQSTPGGWHLIGRTSEIMFDPDRDPPARLTPGDRVEFYAANDVPAPAPVRFTAPIAPPPSGQVALAVIEPGPLLTIQDLGRIGWGHAGVATAGAADMGSARWANQLVGNPDGFAVLEATRGLCRLRLRGDAVIAVTGAIADINVDGLPARARTALPLPSGTEIDIGPARSGLRVYLGVRGGIAVPEVMGSRSTDTFSGLGPAPVAAGDLLPIGVATLLPIGVGTGPRQAAGTAARPEPPLAPPGAFEVPARWGPRYDWLSPDGRSVVQRAEFTVSQATDRTGLRLAGPAVALSRSDDLPSEGMVPGAVQVPPSGQLIVLMRNHPPTGGYPVVVVVDGAGVDLLAQAEPGARVRFRLSDP